jgi:hypothetical protein
LIIKVDLPVPNPRSQNPLRFPTLAPNSPVPNLRSHPAVRITRSQPSFPTPVPILPGVLRKDKDEERERDLAKQKKHYEKLVSQKKSAIEALEGKLAEGEQKFKKEKDKLTKLQNE